MAKVIHLNNTARESIATCLMLEAIKGKAAPLAERMRLLNDKFWDAHKQRLESLSLPEDKWAMLIQNGVCTSCINVTPSYRKPVEGRDENSWSKREYSVYPTSLSPKLKSRNALVDEIFTSEEFTPLFKFITTNFINSYDYKLQFVSPVSVPRISKICSVSIEKAGIHDDLLKLCEDIHLVIQSAIDFRVQALDLMRACRTSKQLEELLPEAMKFLKQPEPREQALVPVELAANIRSMLNKGVPPVIS